VGVGFLIALGRHRRSDPGYARSNQKTDSSRIDQYDEQLSLRAICLNVVTYKADHSAMNVVQSKCMLKAYGEGGGGILMGLAASANVADANVSNRMTRTEDKSWFIFPHRDKEQTIGHSARALRYGDG
jgi:hypothetical protein